MTESLFYITQRAIRVVEEKSVFLFSSEGIKEFGTFVAFYPAVLSFFLIFFSLWFLFFRERKLPFDQSFQPYLSLIIPTHNEETVIAKTLKSILKSSYKYKEIIVVDDASDDKTPKILEVFARKHLIRLVKRTQNGGKATALNDGLRIAQGDIIVGIDADVMIEKYALQFLIQQFQDPEVGGVTGNPQVMNTDSLLTKIQAIEYTSVIGIIKRTESVFGGVYTVSGCAAAFRRSVLEKVGHWNMLTQTEDIELSWRIQKAGYKILYEPRAVFWIQAPKTSHVLRRQRIRWSRGMGEIFRLHHSASLSPNPAMGIIFLESLLTLIWTITTCLILLLTIWNLLSFLTIGGYPLTFLPSPLRSLVPFLVTLFLLQSGAGVLLDRKYNKNISQYYYVSFLFPLYFWIFIVPSFLIGVSKGLLGVQTGQWRRSDRI